MVKIKISEVIPWHVLIFAANNNLAEIFFKRGFLFEIDKIILKVIT